MSDAITRMDTFRTRIEADDAIDVFRQTMPRTDAGQERYEFNVTFDEKNPKINGVDYPYTVWCREKVL